MVFGGLRLQQIQYVVQHEQCPHLKTNVDASQRSWTALVCIRGHDCCQHNRRNDVQTGRCCNFIVVRYLPKHVEHVVVGLCCQMVAIPLGLGHMKHFIHVPVGGVCGVQYC